MRPDNYPWEHIKAATEPLSSDVFIIKGMNENWIFDAGSNDEAYTAIMNLAGKKNLILSHFHGDHSYNIARIKFDNVYCGKNTVKYIKEYADKITVVDKRITIEDGDIFLHIFPISASHCKGSVGLELNNEFAFWGDSAYACEKNGDKIFNVGLLKKEIEELKELQANKVILSHETHPVYKKEIVLKILERFYSKREKFNPYISIKE